jgi:nucleoside-diphosphate-sugar epimerase
MRILLTGADGFTGHHFRAAAEGAGHAVWALDADLCDAMAVQQAVERAAQEAIFDAVLHLAGLAFVGHDDPLAFYRVNVMGTMNLLQALSAQTQRGSLALRQVVVASSANVYGNCSTSPIAESQPPAPVNHYAASKLAMEHLAMTLADALPLRLARPFNYTGPGQSQNFVIPKMVEHFKSRKALLKLGNLQVEREYNDVAWVSQAYLRLLALPAAPSAQDRVVNVSTGVMHPLQAVLSTLQDLTGHRLTVETDPSLVRAQEVHRLCGQPAKLLRLVGPLAAPSLVQTLQAMLDA